MQPKSQFSSSNLAHKASTPKSPAAQFEELNYSTQARQPKSQFSSGIQPTEPQQHSFEKLGCSTQTLNSGHVAKKSLRFIQNSAKSTSRGESGEIKNEYSLRKRLRMSGVPSPKTKKSKRRYVRKVRHQRKEQRGKKGVGLSGGI